MEKKIDGPENVKAFVQALFLEVFKRLSSSSFLSLLDSLSHAPVATSLFSCLRHQQRNRYRHGTSGKVRKGRHGQHRASGVGSCCFSSRVSRFHTLNIFMCWCDRRRSQQFDRWRMLDFLSRKRQLEKTASDDGRSILLN